MTQDPGQRTVTAGRDSTAQPSPATPDANVRRPVDGEHVHAPDAIYARGGLFVAAEYDGTDGLVCLVAGESNADALAEKFNSDLEEDDMAAKKATKKSGKVKAEKKARVAKPKSEKAEAEAKARLERAEARAALLPPVGSVIKRLYHGKVHEVRCGQRDGKRYFAWEGKEYKSLSAIAKLIVKSDYAISGFDFFRKQIAGEEEAA